MKLRNKVLIATGAVWVMFLVLVYTGSTAFLTRSFLSLENERMNRDLHRVEQAIEQNSCSLYTYAADWAHWDDAYYFLRGKNPDFVANNLKIPAFTNSNINLIMYWNNQGKLAAGRAIDTSRQVYAHYPKELGKYIIPLLRSTKDQRGYILTSNGVMLIATSLVTDGDKKLAPAGVLITGRLLSPEMLKKIIDTTQVNFTLYLPDIIKSNPALNKAFRTALQSPSGNTTYPVSDKVIQGFSVIKDIAGKPVGMFQITTPRSIYLTGIKTIRYYLVSFISLGILFSLFMLWLLRAVIIQRLERLNNNVAARSRSHVLSGRVDVQGNDEITSLSTQINQMLATIENAQTRLEYRVKERTQELQKSNVQLQQEITERKSVEKELTIRKEHLAHLAHYDSLTSLPNRIFFNETLTRLLSHARRQKKIFALLYIDLDNFKKINDAFGHSFGDLVLKEIAARLQKMLRAGDMLARLGGDEFVILLDDIEYNKFAGIVAEKLLQFCSKPIKLKASEFVISSSIGICTYPEDGSSFEDLLKNADMAMYKAKQAGGNNFRYYSKSMDNEAHERITLETALRQALHRNEFVLYYQPKFNLIEKKIVGMEALIRWENPELGLISPAKFIPLAEETGLIAEIGEWTLRKACQVNKSWQEQGYEPVPVAVNMSPKQLHYHDIIQLVSDILAETQLNPEYLELEITETAIMNNVETVISKLNALKKMGVKIAIDDFGTGYTSIGYLKQFPVNFLKIDQSFIKGIPANQDDMAITTAVIGLAHNLNIQVIAEGVETPEQMQYLTENHCDIVQGYYLSRPLSETNMTAQLVKSPTATGIKTLV